jgi:hypothetical protein
VIHNEDRRSVPVEGVLVKLVPNEQIHNNATSQAHGNAHEVKAGKQLLPVQVAQCNAKKTPDHMFCMVRRKERPRL